MASEFKELADYIKRWPTGKWIIYALEVMGIIATLVGFLGVVFQGLRFLGQFATSPEAVVAIIAVLAALTWFACGYVLLKKEEGTSPWRQRSPAFSGFARGIALSTLVANVAVTLYLFLGVLQYDITHAQPVEEGQLGVAVAQFGEGTEMRASARGRELSAFVARSLRREIDLLPGLGNEVTILSAPLVRSEEAAAKVARETNVVLIIWGWVSETAGDVFVPTFTFVESPGAVAGLKELPPWYEVEIRGDGTLDLGHTVARRASGLIDYILGLIYLNREDYEAAAARFQQAIELTEKETRSQPPAEHEAKPANRSLAIYHLALGRTFAAQAEPEQARAEYETALGYDPGYGPIYIGLGNIDYAERKCQEALQWFEKAVEFAPTKPSAWYSRGNAYFCMDEYAFAAADYQQAIGLTDRGDKALSLYRLVHGVALCRLNRFSEGQAEISRAQRLAPPESTMRQAATAELESCEAPTPSPTGTPFPRATLLSTAVARPTSTATQFPTRFPTRRPLPPTATLFPTSTVALPIATITPGG